MLVAELETVIHTNTYLPQTHTGGQEGKQYLSNLSLLLNHYKK